MLYQMFTFKVRSRVTITTTTRCQLTKRRAIEVSLKFSFPSDEPRRETRMQINKRERGREGDAK